MTGSAELISIGTELLLGDIANTNAQFLAQQLAQLGIPHYYQTVVGDNVDRIQKALAIATGRSRILITTGGLGPTPDDLTIAAIADFFDTPLVEHPDIWEAIQQRFARLGREVPPSNRKQALLPAGADVLPNPTGTAPGILWEPQPGLLILTFPGVPAEMRVMWQETAVPFLRSRGYGQHLLQSRLLHFWGIGESALAERVAPLLDSPNPTVAPYANRGHVKLRLTARAPTAAAAEALLDPMEAEIRQRVGDDCYGRDDDTLVSAVGALLRSRRETLAVAESCTGGGLGQMLTDIPGSSDYFMGGIISYSNAVKTSLLGVSPDDLATYGAVSVPVAQQMACGVKQRLGSDWGLSITGIAGPGGGTESKPVGLVYIGLATPDGEVLSFEQRCDPSKDRNWIRYVSACSALDRLRRRFVMIEPNNTLL